MEYICDSHRHLVCLPYSIENLHSMAESLELNLDMFHTDHYEIPQKRILEIEDKCRIVTTKEIVGIVHGIY